MNGMTIAEIAQARGLTVGTIMGHLEKLASHGSRLNLEHLDFPSDRLEEIKAAFARSGGQALSSVRALLGENFSYEELRLARLIVNNSK